MPRTLPPGLATKIASYGQTPELAVTVQDLQTRLSTLAVSSLSGRSAAILSSTRTIIRAVCAQAAATNQTVTVQTITPTSPSSWQGAGVAVTTNAVARAGCALVQTAGTTRCFYQRTSDNHICYRDSTDDGLTWGAEISVGTSTPPGSAYCYGICADTTGYVHSAWAAFDPNGMCGIYAAAFGGVNWGVWTSVGPPTPAWGQVRGINVATVAGTRRFLAGMGLRGYTSGISAAWFTWDGTTYSGATALQTLDTPSQGLTLAYPDIFYDGSKWWAIVTMTDDGSVSTSAHTRTTLYTSTDGATWQPYLNAGSALQYGAHVIVAGGTIYIFDAKYTYVPAATPAPQDIGSDIFLLQITEAYDQPAELGLTLSNDSLQYTNASWLIDNATITVSLGYSGQTVTTHTFYIDDYSIRSTAEGLILQVAGRNALKLLDYPATTMQVFRSQTIYAIAQAICRQVPITLAASPGTSQFSQVVPCFIITPGETWLSALKRLGNIFSFNFRADPTPQVILFDPQQTDPSTWSYGTEILASEYGTESNRPNVVRVTGAQSGTTSYWSEATDSANILLVGDERFRLVVDRMLDTSAKCQLRASQELRQVQREAGHGAVVVALNPQHELGDVITVTDAASGLNSTALRINAIQWTFNPDTAEYTSDLRLELP